MQFNYSRLFRISKFWKMDSKFNKITPNVTLYTLRNTKKNI